MGVWRKYQRWRVADFRHTGSVLEWKHHFGWIAPDANIDHPEASKHGWRVYVHVSDIDGDVRLCSGSRVSFFAYTDGDGIGAECVRPEEDAATDLAARIGWEEEEPFESGPAGQWRGRWGKGRVQRTIEKREGPGGACVGGAKGKGKGFKGKACKGGPGRGCGAAAPTGGRVLLLPGPGSGGPGPAGPDRSKATSSGAGRALVWAASEMRGWRPAMEDATRAILGLAAPLQAHALFGVFDGHGGAAVSQRAAAELPAQLAACAARALRAEGAAGLAANALAEALPALDEALRAAGAGEPGPPLPMCAAAATAGSEPNAFALTGSTAVVALVECAGPPAFAHPLRVVVANCGDSRALLCRGGEALPLSEDQKPDVPCERERIERAGGFVAPVGPCQRIDGWGLNLSRALGDFHYKARTDLPPSEQKVTAVPEVRSCDLTEEDEFLLLCCDGVFELKTSQEAVDHVRSGLLSGKPPTEVVEDLVDSCCSPDLMQTRGQGSDNVSAMVVLLR